MEVFGMEGLLRISSCTLELHICIPSIHVPISFQSSGFAPCADFYLLCQTWLHQACSTHHRYPHVFQKLSSPQASFLLSVAFYLQPFSSDEEFEQLNSLKKYATFLRA